MKKLVNRCKWKKHVYWQYVIADSYIKRFEYVSECCKKAIGKETELDEIHKFCPYCGKRVVVNGKDK